MIAVWVMAVSFASVARLERPCVGPGDCASRLEGRGLPHAASAVLVQHALRGPGPGYREALGALVDREQDGPSDALEAVASGTDPQTWPTELRSTLVFHRARWLARNGHPTRAIRLLHGDTSQRALLLTGTLLGQSTTEGDRITAVTLLARAARDPDGVPDNRDLALVNAGRVLGSLDRPDLAWALFSEVDPDGAHGLAASHGALWCELALGYGDRVQRRLEQLGRTDAETLYLAGVLAAHEGRIDDARAARDALVAVVDGEAWITDTVSELRGTVGWAAWEALGPAAPASLRAHVDDRATMDAGLRTVDEVVAEFQRVRHREEIAPALRADLASVVDRLGTQVAGAVAARRTWRDAAAHLSALVAEGDAPHQADQAPSAVYPLRASAGRWGAPADVADGTYAGPLPTPRTPDLGRLDDRVFGDPEPEPGNLGLSAQGGPHPLSPGHHLVRLTVAAPEGRTFQGAGQGLEVGVAFDPGAVVSVRRIGDDAPWTGAVGTLRPGGRATILFDVRLADVPGETLATVTTTGGRRGAPAQVWTFPLPVALVNPRGDAGDRRHLLLAAVAGGVGERLAGQPARGRSGPTSWDVLADERYAGRPRWTSDVATLMEVLGDLRGSPVIWDETSAR